VTGPVASSAVIVTGANTTPKKAQAKSAMEKGFTTQLMKSVTSKPAGRLPTFRTEEKSTFIIMGVIMSQISTAMGTLIWLPFPNSIPRRPAIAAGSNLPRTTPAPMQSATQAER
jgi:hypothetical protein